MTNLYLVRHGRAVPHGTPEIPDDERPLTRDGRKRMKQVARGLERLGVAPDRIIASPLPRALQTAEILAGVLGLEDALETADALRAHQSAATVRDWINTRTEARPMVVGHDPWITDLVGLLITGEPGMPLVNFRKGGVAAFAPAAVGGGLRLDWLARPRLLRALGD